MATTHFTETGGLYPDPENPSHAPLVFKIGNKADDARFRALGLNTTSEDPDINVLTIHSDGRFVAFDKKGEFIDFHFTQWGPTYRNLFGDGATPIDPNASSTLGQARRGEPIAAYLAIFTQAQLAEFLTLTGGTLTGTNQYGEKVFEFDRKPPIQVVELLNPHTDEVEPVLVLDSVPKFSVVAKVVGKLIKIKDLFRTEHQLNLFVCLDEIFGLDSKYHHETDPEQKGIKLKAVDEAKARFAALIPEEARAFHTLATDARFANSSRAELHALFYSSRPAHTSALKLIAARAEAAKAPKPVPTTPIDKPAEEA